MAKFVLKNVRLFCDGADLTTVNNQIQLQAEAESKDTTAFAYSGDVWHEEISGIKSASLSASGQWEAGDPSLIDNMAWSTQGSQVAVSACPATAGVGELAWLTKLNRTQYSLLGQVGEVAPWSLTGQGSWPLVRGKVLVAPTAATGVAFGGTAVRIPGGVPSGKHLYAAIHVFSVSGSSTPTISALVQSDDNEDLTSATHRITFSPITSVGSQIARAAGPITDDYFQVYADLTGVSQSFLIAVTAGVA